jgi:hypothetical protein
VQKSRSHADSTGRLQRGSFEWTAIRARVEKRRFRVGRVSRRAGARDGHLAIALLAA